VTLSAGTRLGVYEIVAPLGAGGMGEVYRARDTRLSREVAIKVLPSATASDPDRRLRFEQEARSASALNHPNILTIHDVGSSDGTVYIAMELVDGKTLRELISGGEPLPMRRLLDVATQTAEGLAKAHGAGIVHRDLKPENLMVSRDGFVKILDFGSRSSSSPSRRSSRRCRPPSRSDDAGHRDGHRRLHVAGAGVGPERGLPQRPVHPRRDPLRDGDREARVRAQDRRGDARRDHPRGSRAARAGGAEVAGAVRWIVERLLAKDPEERYASTKDLARDLKSVRDHLSETTTSASGALEAAGPARAKRRGWLLPAAIAFALGAVLAGLAIARLGAFPAAAAAVPEAHVSGGERSDRPASPRTARRWSTALVGRRTDGDLLDQPGEPRVEAARPALRQRPRRFAAGELAISLGWHLEVGWESTGTLARVPLAGGAPREILENVEDADWSPDGKELAVIYQKDARGRLEYPIGKVMAESSGWLSNARVSPDGRRSRCSITRSVARTRAA
jgi:hypothetical protein